MRDQRGPGPVSHRPTRTRYCHLYMSSFFFRIRSGGQTRRAVCRHHAFFCASCKRPFSKTLTPTECQDGKIVWPRSTQVTKTALLCSLLATG